MKKTVGICLVAAVVALSGCSSNRGPQASGGLSANGQGANAYGAGGNSAYSHGLGSSEGFGLAKVCQIAPPQPGDNQHYFFAFDKSNIKPQATQSLHNQSQYLNSHSGVKARIEGNTDDRGSREYNIGLGWRRARAIASMLEQYGVNKKQLVLVSYGAEKPVAFGHTPQDYQCNRRVDLKYIG